MISQALTVNGEDWPHEVWSYATLPAQASQQAGGLEGLRSHVKSENADKAFIAVELPCSTHEV